MTVVIHDTTVVTADPDGAIHYAAAIAVDGDRIARIGPSAEVLAGYPDADRVDGTGQAVMPGFANTHTHFNMTIARGIYEDLSPPNQPPFTGGLAELPLPNLAPDDNRVMCQLGALEAIKSGTTAVLEDAVRIAAYAEAMVASGLRIVFAERASDKARGSIGDPGGFEADPALARDGLARIAALHSDWHGAGDRRITVAVSAHAPDMCSPELLRELRRLQERLDTLATIHLNQIWGEVAAVSQVRGELPTEYLARHGFLHDRLVAAHCRCMTPREEELLGAAGASVAFNSAIAARRGLSPRAAELAAAGCNIALGSDNMAEDMVEVMRTALFMERVRTGDGRRPTPELALRWATANGYRALGIERAGSLQPGYKADLIMVDCRKAHLVPLMRIVSSFVHQGQASDVDSVMVDGNWLMRAGRVLTMDEAAIVDRADRIGRAAWSRLFRTNPDLPVPGGFAPVD